MESLEEMKQHILNELNAYRRKQHGFIQDNKEFVSRQLIVRLERKDFSAYEANQRSISCHLSDIETNSQFHGTVTQHHTRAEDVVQLDRIEASLNENDGTNHTVLQTNATTLDSDIDVELENTDADGQSYDVDCLVHEAERLRYTYYPVDAAGNLANPIFFVPGTNLFGNQQNQDEFILHIPSPDGNQELTTNSTTHEIVELQRNSHLETLDNYVNRIENSETIGTDLTLERRRFISLENTFLEKVQDYMERKNYTQKLMTKARYWDLIETIKKTKNKPLLSVKDRIRLKNYDVVTIGESEKLIVPIIDLTAPIIFYVHNEEIFQILIDVHLSLGHVGKQVMWIELNKKYKNITKDVIGMFLDLCDSCKARTLRVPPSPSNELERHLNTSRVQVRELIQTHVIKDVPEFIDVENFKEMESRFNAKMTQIANSMVDSVFFMTKSTYYNLLQNIKNAECNVSYQTDKERRLLHKIGIATISGKETLIAPIQGENLKYLHIEELFTAIHKVHITHKHSAKDIMIRLLSREYMNVAMVAVEEYIRLCQLCQRRRINSPEEIRRNYLESDEMVLDLYTMDKSPHCNLSIPEMNLLFNLRLGELIDLSGCEVLTKHSYSLLIQEVKTAQRKTSKDLRDHHLSCLYDVIEYKGEEILTASFRESEDTPCIVKHYVYLEQAFYIIHDCHISSGHSSNHIMMAELTKKYQNINADMVTLYLELCGFCMNKHAAYNKILIAQPLATLEENKRENDITTNSDEQTEHRTSLFDTDKEDVEETEDMEDILIEISSDSSSDVEELVPERTDESVSNKLVQIEEHTLNDQSSNSSREVGLEAIETGAETEPNDEASEVIELEETNLLINVDAKFEVEGPEEIEVNYDLPETVDVDQMTTTPKTRLKTYNDLNIEDLRSSGSVLLIDSGPEAENVNQISIVAKETDLDNQSEVEDSDKVSLENKNSGNRNKTGSGDFQMNDSSGEIDSGIETEKIVSPKYIKDKFVVIKFDKNRETILAVKNAEHVHTKKKNILHDDMIMSNVNEGITTPTKNTDRMDKQASSDAQNSQSLAGKMDINHESDKIGEICFDSDIEVIEGSSNEQFRGQEPLEKGTEGSIEQINRLNGSSPIYAFQCMETGAGLKVNADSEISSAEATVSDNPTSKCPVTEENESNLDDANEEISMSFEERRLNLDQPVDRMCTNRKMLIGAEKEAFDQSVNMASILSENEDIPIAVDGSSSSIIEEVINEKPENTCKECSIAGKCMKYIKTTDACTQTSKIATVESEPNETNQNGSSSDYPELKKLDDQSASERKTRFMERLRHTKSVNGSVISKKAYFYLIEQVKRAKSNDSSKLVIDKNRVHNYDVIRSGNTERLVTPIKTGSSSMKIYVHIEEVFDIIHSAHLDTNHGGVLRMLKLLRGIYQNITRDMTRIYLETCSVCKKTFDIGSRCQADIIDMHNHQVDGYSHILVYHHHTKLVQLRPLKSKQVCEVAEAMLDIFAIFGVPNIIHTSRSRCFTSSLVREICKQWRQIKIVFGKPKPKQANTVKIESMLACWMKANAEKKWTDSLRYLQVEINSDQTSFNAHQATFGTPFSFGLIPSLDHVTTENELERALYNNDDDDEILSSEISSEEASDETDESSLSDTLTTDDGSVAVNSSYSVVRTKRATSDDDMNTKKKTKLT